MDQDILDLKRRAGILNEQEPAAGPTGPRVQGVRGAGTDPLKLLDTETFMGIINATIEAIGQRPAAGLNPQQKVQVARTVIAQLKGGDAEDEQADAQAQAQAQQPAVPGTGDPLA